MDIKPFTTQAMLAMQQNAHSSAHGSAMSRHDQLQMKKLKKAASEFESMLISNWWNTMKQSGLPGTDDDTDPGKDTLDQMGINALSAAIAGGKHGLGLGEILVHSLMERAEEGKTATAAGTPAATAAATTTAKST